MRRAAPEPTTDLSRRGMLRGMGLTAAATLAAPLALGAGAAEAEAAGLGTSGVAVTTSRVNLRQGAGTRFHVLRVLGQGQRVTLNGRAVGRWQPVRVGKLRGYVSTRYLRRVGAARRRVTSSQAVAPVAAGFAGLPVAVNYSAPSGCTSRGRAIAAEVHQRFPQVATIHGYRPGAGSDHGTGHAIDIMLPGDYRGAAQQALGQAMADFLRANASRLGISYVIWHQHIWSVARAGEGWRAQSNRGSDNANHVNHVHVSYN